MSLSRSELLFIRLVLILEPSGDNTNMMKKIILGTGFFIAVVVLSGLYNFLVSDRQEGDLMRLLVGNSVFKVEIVDEPVEQARGLSGRDQFPENQGMLFVFPNAAIRSFWMRGMQFPLDIVWIRGDEIIGFSENLLPAVGLDYPFYSPPAPVDKVLEINAGLVKKLGLKIGDKLLLE